MGRIIIAGAAVLALPLALWACRPADRNEGSGLIPPADAPANPTEPASAPGAAAAVGAGQAIEGGGTEPFWAVKIRRDVIVLSRPDHPDVMGVNPGPAADGGRTVWRSTASASGEPLVVTLEPGPCTNGMSDRTFALKARVALGGEILNGCAAPMAAPAAAPVAAAQGGAEGEGLPEATE